MDETHFDAVVVGSGFGGSVMAYRLAEAGMRVCLLERGKAYPPGSFPRSPYGMKNNVWDPSEGFFGLFNIWSFQNLAAIISSGLGGGSLIYANVLLRKDERWFVRDDARDGSSTPWPVTRADLDPHYDRVEKMLNAQVYPFDQPPYDATSKTRAFRAAAQQLKLDWFLPKLAVTFGNEGEAPVPGEPIREAQPNLHGRTRSTCRLCGECDFGCNYGSKNTLDYTYLSEAKRLGADLRTCCEVKNFAPRDGGGYTIDYVRHDPAAQAAANGPSRALPSPPLTITADRLILSAGTLGSTYLLLKNRAAFPKLSEALGTRFCDNGDLLAFALKCRDDSSGSPVPRVIDAGRGPVITSTIRVADSLDGGQGRGFYIQDAGYPEFVSWLLQLCDVPAEVANVVGVVKRVVGFWLRRGTETDVDPDLERLFGSCELSAGLLPLLGMGRNVASGTMELRGKFLDVDWPANQALPYVQRVRDTMHGISQALGGTFLDDPIWWLSRVITVHALGGCPMGQAPSEGVVDSHGQVFNYPGLYVADGSVMPAAVGANPSLTIAALADRFADGIVEGRGTGDR